jgi:CxxC motif-containing protein (DUF1111 family)
MADQADVAVGPGAAETEVLQRFDGNSRTSRTFESPRIRRTPPLFGLGLIENAQERYLGTAVRPVFGAFGEVGSIDEFVERAFAVELGVSTENRCARKSAGADYPSKCLPGISAEQLSDVTFFIRNLAAPVRSRDSLNREGAALFKSFGCAECHTPSLKTTEDSPFHIRSRVFYAYSDLQMHDLGGEMKVRTAPLWGLNSIGPPYLHDASAVDIQGAIEKHGGAATESRQKFESASSTDQSNLLAFLRAL